MEDTGLGVGKMGGYEVSLARIAFGGSMGSVVGEKITRAIGCLQRRIPVIIVSVRSTHV